MLRNVSGRVSMPHGPFHSRSLDMIGPGVFDIDDIDSPIMQRTLLQDVRFTIDFDLIGR